MWFSYCGGSIDLCFANLLPKLVEITRNKGVTNIQHVELR